MNRSNSFGSSLKWWPLQNHLNETQTNDSSGIVSIVHEISPSQNFSVGNGVGLGFRSFIPFNKTSSHTFGSSIGVQKLRESKWFKSNEERIFCAVVECGFIVEVRSSATVPKNLILQQLRWCSLRSIAKKTRLQINSGNNSNISNDSSVHEEVEEFCKHHQTSIEALFSNVVDNHQHHDDFVQDVDNDNADELDLQNENQLPITTWFGLVLCKTNKDNKPMPETIEIYSVKIREKGTFKILKMSLDNIWDNGWELRINNFADKEKPPHNKKDIKNQISFARKARQSLWNNNKHFVYWCRYGSRQQDIRKRQMSECVKLSSAGMNAGMLLLMNKKKSYSTSK